MNSSYLYQTINNHLIYYVAVYRRVHISCEEVINLTHKLSLFKMEKC